MSIARARLAVLTCCLGALLAGAAGAQPRGDSQGPRSPRRMSPPEIQRLFDAYTLKHAQAALELNDAQYGQFQPRMRALQETRRRNLTARVQTLQALSEAVEKGDEAAIRRHLEALHEHDTRAAAELQQAYAAIDAMLDLPQRARFRLFEETMERRKFELLTRAKQSRGGAAAPRRRPN